MTTDIVTMRRAARAARRAGHLEAAAQYLAKRGIISHGIQTVGADGRWIDYVNRGDTYDTTVYRDGLGRYCVGSWGSWLEATEARQCKRDRTIQCGYCSHFTPKNKRDWRAVVCEQCGHNVGG